MQYILGIDQSTQGTKAILVDENGKMVGRADKSHRQRQKLQQGRQTRMTVPSWCLHFPGFPLLMIMGYEEKTNGKKENKI